MKTTRSLTRLLLVCTTLGGLIAGCTNGSNDGATPKTDCRIQRIVSTTKTGFGATGTAETVYDYDATGNLAKQTLTSTNRQSSGSSDNTTTTTQYQYDAAGFLTNSVYSIMQKTASSTGEVYTYQSTSAKVYTYTNNRLAGYAQTDVVLSAGGISPPQQRTTVLTNAYEYDAAGQLVKEVNSNGTTWTYRNGQAVDVKSYFPYVLENGLITKATFPGTDATGKPLTLVQTFQYDAQRRLIKYQECLNDVLESYYTKEWQTGKSAATALPVFKGHPAIQSPYGEGGVLTKYSRNFVNHQQGNTAYLFNEQTNTNQLNAQGFVTHTQTEVMYFTNGQKQPDVTTTVYTYTGCN